MKKILVALATAFLCLATGFAQAPNCKIQKYECNDGGILTHITPSGKWAVINLGTSAGGGTAVSQLYDIEQGVVVPVTYNGRNLGISSVSDDGNVVVGSFSGRPMAYNRATGKLTLFPLRQLWQMGHLDAVTPDGKWAVGYYNGYNGKLDENDELNHDYYYSTLMVNIETGDTVATPGLPRRDMAHLDQHAMKFSEITPDGRYVIGQMSWYIMQPQSGFVFIYDTQLHNYEAVGYIEHDNRAWEPKYPDMHHVEGTVISPDGHWLSGMAYMTHAHQDDIFFNEYGVPFLLDIRTRELTVFDEAESNNFGVGAVDNLGTIFGNPDTGSPLRDFRVLHQGKYWISLNQICKQVYGFDFREKTGYERTGTVMGVSGDGRRFIAFPDPLGESYCFDFGEPVEDVCDRVDLLDNYSVSPASGSIFAQLSTIEINFGRAVQVLGTGKNVHLYKADGTKVADGLSAGNQGLSLKTGSKTTVNVAFRTRLLDAGESYYVTIDAGVIAVANDAQRANKEIRIDYVGRANGPVQLVKAAPESHAQLRQLDASTSYILLSFDSPVKLTEKASAYLVRVEDGSRMATLTLSQGNTESTKHQILLYPASAVYLYDGLEYQVVVEAGSVCDYSDAEASYNETISLTYHGTYVREIGNDAVLFSDNFNDPAQSYAMWLRYEGDHRTPLNSMQLWGFDADNMPWSFGMSDDQTYADCFAGSHSLYAPSGQSDDWMVTPQLQLPEGGVTRLDFDAQSYNPAKTDVLKIYVYEQDFNISYLNDAWMNDDDGFRKNAVLLEEITLIAGDSQDKTAGEWTHYSFDLSPWAGKNVYVAFVNQNQNQSAIFVDNVTVQRELLYSIGFANADRVVDKGELQISGQFTVRTDKHSGKISLTLKDASGKEISQVVWPNVSGNVKDRPIPFTFQEPLPLTVGKENKFTIDVLMGDHLDVFEGSILDLSFEPTKHVVLEEMTGVDCPNCPLGIITIEKCEKAFGEQFIPVSIHTYPGDPWMGSLEPYSTFLGLQAAPSARINRTSGVYYPIVSEGGKYLDTNPDSPLWFDVVSRELSRLAPCDLSLAAVQDADGQHVQYKADLRYAVDADQQLSLLVLILENGLEYYQANNLGSLENTLFGEWGAGGLNSGAYAYPVIHNDVVRLVVGQTFSGTIGLFPSTLEAGQTYSATFSSNWPQAIDDVRNATAVAMLIDSQSGEVINACKTGIQPPTDGGLNGIEDVIVSEASDATYTLSGVRVAVPTKKGVYISNGKKYIK